jgi:membrane associated rhomboid family serine protease
VRRVPWLTLAVTLVTAGVSLTQLGVPGLLDRLERSPAARHAEPWRLLTSLLVQDGGVPGTVSNLGALVVLGVLAERMTSRLHWLAGYLGAGLVGEVAGLWWQPVGGGNSVAVCGLSGLLTVAVVRSERALSSAVSLTVLVWVSLLLGGQAPELVLPGVVVAVVVQHLGRRVPRLRYVVPVAAVGTAVILLAARDIHGAALAAGLVVACLLTWRTGGGPPMAG